MADNPHIGGSLPEVQASVERLASLTDKVGKVVTEAEARAARMAKRLQDLEARLERNAARAQPFRAVEQAASGQVTKVVGYGSEAAAQGLAAHATPTGTRTIGVQPNPAFDAGWAKDLRTDIELQRQALRNLTAEIRGEAGVRQKVADQALAGARAEQQAQSQVVSAQVAKAKALQASAVAERGWMNRDAAADRFANVRGLPEKATEMPKSPMATGRHFIAQEAQNYDFRHPDVGGAYPPRPGTSGGGGAGIPPVQPPAPPTPPPPPPGGGPSSPAANAARKTAIMNEAQLAEASQRGASVWQRNTAAIAANSDVLRRHGALTTEFIAAAARGQASYREWGYQIGATAGKFAGWTLVSIPVFAALDGVRKIGQGAVASADGVNQLQRVLDTVDSGAAQQSFRDLSRQFNVGPDVAARAVYLAGQRFHDLGNAVDAASASLYAFKTGELDIDKAAQGLNAVASAFGLSGADVANTFDQINQAQNRLGANIPDMVSGLAKAGGAFRNAGGDPQALITLLTAARLAAGRTGDQAATAIQRSAGYVGRPSNQKALRGFGIDPTLPYYTSTGPSMVGEAVGVTRSLLAQGRTADIERLAAALSSPQFASMFVPILRAAAEGRTAQQGNILAISPIVSPEASANSARQELAKLLASPREQFAAFGHELERLGSAIGESGLLSAVTRLSLGFTGIIAVTERTLSVLNDVPAAFQQITFLAAAVGGSRALGRRFGIGEGSGGLRNAIFGRSEEQQARLAVQAALRDNRDYLRQNEVGLAGRAQRAGLQQDVAARRLSDVVASGPRVGETKDHYEERVSLHQDQVNKARRLGYAAEEERAVLQQLSKDQLRLQAAFTEAARSGKVLDLATRERIWVVPTQERPTDLNPAQVGGRRLYEAGKGATDVAERQLLLPGLEGRDALMRNAADKELALKQRLDAGRQAFRESQGAAERVGAAASLAGTAASGTAESFGRAGQGLRGLGRSMYEMIGGFGAFIIGVDLAIAAGEAIKEHERKLGDRATALGEDPKGASDAQARIDKAKSMVPEGDLERAKRHRNSYSDNQWAEINAGITEQDRRDRNAALRARGRGGVDLRADEIAADYARAVKLQGAERTKALGAVLTELDHTTSKTVTPAFREGMRESIGTAFRATKRASGSLLQGMLADLKTVDLTGLGKDLDVMAEFIATGQAKLSDVQEFYGEGIAQLAAGAPGPGAGYTQRTRYAARLDQFAKTIEAPARNTLNDALGAATTQAERDRAYQNYYERVGKADDKFQKDLAANTQKGAGLRRRLAAVNRRLGPRVDPRATGVLQPDLTVDQSGAQVLDSGVEYGQALADRDKLLDKLKKVGVDRDKIRTAIRRANARIKTLVAEMHRQQAIEDAQDRLDTIQVDAELYASQTTDPDVAARRRIEGLRKQLTAMKGDPKNTGGVKAQKRIQTQINEAVNSLADSQKQEINDLIDAQFAFRESQTDDPVEIARLEYLKSVENVRNAPKGNDPKSRAARLRALADRNTKLREYRNQRVTSAEEDIDFDLSMERISTQTAIERYNALLKTKNLGKAERRKIQQRVHDLMKQQDSASSSLDLDVGSLKLPTVYDVRRAFDPIRSSIKAARDRVPEIASLGGQTTTGDALIAGQRGAAMTSPAMNNVTFNIQVTDPNAASEVYAAIDRAMKTKVKAKMKSRGHR